MATKIGAGIALDGEKEFKSAVSNINSEIKVLASEMKKVTSAFDSNANSVSLLTSKSEVLNRQVESQKQKIDLLKDALENAKKEYGENDKRVDNWKISLNNAEAELNKLNKEVGENDAKLKDAKSSTKGAADSVKQFADSADDAGKKTLTLGDLIKGNLISGAIIGGVKALGNALVSAGKEFANIVKSGVEYNAQMEQYTASFATMLGDEAEAQKLVNNLKKEAAATPFGMQDLAGSVQTMMSFGISAQDAQKSMKQLGDISQGDAEKLKSLTLAFAQTSSTGKLTGQDLLQMINAGFNPLEEISRKTGKSIGQLKEEMAKGAISADMVSEAFASATSEGGRFYGAMDKQSKTFSGQMSTLKDGVSSLTGQLSEQLTGALSDKAMPAINGVVTALSGLMSGAVKPEEFKNIMSDAINGIVESVKTVIPELINTGVIIIKSLIEGIGAAMPDIMPVVMEVVNTLVTAVIDLLPVIVQAGMDILLAIANGIGDSLPTLIPQIVNVVLQIVKILVDNIPKLIDAGIKILMGLVDGIIKSIPILVRELPKIIKSLIDGLLSAIPQIIDAGIQLLTALVQELPIIINNIVEVLPQIIDGIITALINSIPLIIETGIDLLISLVDALPKIITEIVKAIPKIITSIVSAIVNNIDKIIDAGVKLIVALVSDIPAIITGLVKAIPVIIEGLVTSFGSYFSKMKDVGKDLISGIWEGIKDAATWIWDKLKGWCNDLVGKVKGFLGIASPSVLFREQVGKNLALGIGDGFSAEMKNVTDEMNNAIPTSFDTDINITGRSPLSGARPTINLNFYAQKIDDSNIDYIMQVANMRLGKLL